ncbi:MAG: C4-type zinc ribbon domain-containing protein [Pirellula sp.]
MNVSDSVVRTLHQTLVQIADIKTQIDRGPKQLKAAQAQVDAVKDLLQKCKDSIKQKKMEADRKQLQLREREGKIHDWEGKMNSASNNREYQAIKEQIAADMQANNVLSDEILETLEEIDSLQSNLKDLEEKLRLTEADKVKTDASVAQRIDTLKGELVRVEGNLAAAEKDLTPEFQVDFKRLVNSRGEDGMAALDDVSCGGCCTGLPPRILDRLRMGQPIPCPSCGRLLYRAE